MNKAKYLDEVRERLINSIVKEFKFEGYEHNQVRGIVDQHFADLKKKFFLGHSVRPGRTKDELIRLFTFEKPYVMKYHTLGYSREHWLADIPVLNEMIKEGSVSVCDRGRNYIIYHYHAPLPLINQ